MNIIALTAMLLVPPPLLYGILWNTQDVVLTTVGITLVYIGLVAAYDSQVEQFHYNWYVSKDFYNVKDKVLEGLVFTAAATVTTFGMLFFFTLASPWYITEIQYPGADMTRIVNEIYLVISLLFFVLVLPIGECLFYFVFQTNKWEGFLGDLIVSSSFGLMTLAALAQVI